MDIDGSYTFQEYSIHMNWFITPSVKHMQHIVIISSPHEFMNNRHEIEQWLMTNNCVLQGIVILFPNEETYLLFLIRWGT